MDNDKLKLLEWSISSHSFIIIVETHLNYWEKIKSRIIRYALRFGVAYLAVSTLKTNAKHKVKILQSTLL